MGLWNWLRGRRNYTVDDYRDVLSELRSGPGGAGMRSAGSLVPPGYATLLLGDAMRISYLSDFVDAIDETSLVALTAGIDGIGEHEMVGTISRPGGGVRWEPHPLFTLVGATPIEFTRDQLSLVTQPGPHSTSKPYFRLLLVPFQELPFRLVEDLDLDLDLD